MSLNHRERFINDQRELVSYLNFLSEELKRFAAIRHFRDQIMQLHAHVEDMMYEFVKFLDHDSILKTFCEQTKRKSRS